jgi:hypothetical protein
LKKYIKFIIDNKWLLSLVIICIVTLVGLVISIYLGTYIPLWLLFGFAVIFCANKWFRGFTVSHKNWGKFYRLILNCAILALSGLIIFSGIQLFTKKQFLENQLIGSILFVIEIILFISLWRVIKKNSWRWPSMKLTAFSLICLFLIFAFAGVQPISGYKNTAINNTSKLFSSITSANSTSSTLTTKPKTIIFDNNWTIALNKVNISGSTVKANISITSRWSTPTYFGGDFLSPYTFICVDQYGKIFEDQIEAKKVAQSWQDLFEGDISFSEEPNSVNFYKGEYYPKETRSGNLEFEVNALSGKIALYIGRFVGYSSKVQLFDLGTLK